MLLLLLQQVLVQMTAVEHADISDVIAGRPEELALRVLTILCEALTERNLLTIDVSDNAMGEKGINACRAVLSRQTTLQSLSMCNDGLSASAMEAMRDLILADTAEPVPGALSSAAAALQVQTTQLRKLHFFNNMSGDGGAKVSEQRACLARGPTHHRV